MNKNQHATSSMDKNYFYEEENQCTSIKKCIIKMQRFSKIKIRTQQVPRTNIRTQKNSLRKSVSRGEKINEQFSQKEIYDTSLTNKK